MAASWFLCAQTVPTVRNSVGDPSGADVASGIARGAPTTSSGKSTGAMGGRSSARRPCSISHLVRRSPVVRETGSTMSHNANACA